VLSPAVFRLVRKSKADEPEEDVPSAPLVIELTELAWSSAMRILREVAKSALSVRLVVEDEVLLVDDCNRPNRLLAIPSAEKSDMAAPEETFEMHSNQQ
jgi:hypothetical protein